mgnify:FL=1|tara:strand:- start:127 stop:321 length:195 start_codon:yes stop_codon:yes gene_type:complete
MQPVIRSSEDQLTREIHGLHSQLNEMQDDLSARRAASFIRQVIKSKVEKRATLRYQREQDEESR